MKILVVTLILFSTISFASGGIIFTPCCVTFWGECSWIKVGDIVEAYDPDGILCGRVEVRKTGYYGLLNVYGDDLSTPEDEGANLGDELSFYVNGAKVSFKDSQKAIWVGDKEIIRIDIE